MPSTVVGELYRYFFVAKIVSTPACYNVLGNVWVVYVI